MDCLEFANVSFHPSASIGHLSENLCTFVGQVIWYDTFSFRNTKWLWLVNDYFSALNNDNVLCGSFGLYHSYVAGILHSVKEIHFYALCAKTFVYTQYIERCITAKVCTITFGRLSKINFVALPYEQHFMLTYAGETVTVSFLTRLFPELPSEQVFADSVLSRIRLSSLTYEIVSLYRHVTCITNEVVASRHDCVF